MEFEFKNDTPIYLQISEFLKIEIFSGVYMPKDKLPSVRELAISLKVNPNTVQKALTELEDEGLIYTERTSGKFVTADKELILKSRYDYANSLTNKYLSSMKKIGFDKDDVLKRID